MYLCTAKLGRSRPCCGCPLCSSGHYRPPCGNPCLIFPGVASLHTSRGRHLHILWNYAINVADPNFHTSCRLFSGAVQGRPMKLAAQQACSWEYEMLAPPSANHSDPSEQFPCCFFATVLPNAVFFSKKRLFSGEFSYMGWKWQVVSEPI